MRWLIMKQKFKGFVLAILTVAVIFSMTACTSLNTSDTGVDKATADSLTSSATQMMNSIFAMDSDQLQQIIQQEQEAKETAVADGLKNWLDIKDKMGAFVSIDSSTVQEVDTGYLVRLEITCENRKGKVLFGVDKALSKINQLTFNMTETLPEKLKSAGQNLVVGMIVVFAVLIFIAWIISLFKYINIFEQKLNKKKGNAPETEPAAIPAAAAEPDAPAAATVNDGELVAVITAAIAASEGTASDGLVVRSIRRMKTRKWKNG